MVQGMGNIEYRVERGNLECACNVESIRGLEMVLSGLWRLDLDMDSALD